MNQLPRLLFLMSLFLGNWIARYLHCSVGRPRSWFNPPNL